MKKVGSRLRVDHVSLDSKQTQNSDELVEIYNHAVSTNAYIAVKVHVPCLSTKFR